MRTHVDRLRWVAHRVAASKFVTEHLPSLRIKLGDYMELMRLDRPIGIWLLLWPTLWALWLASSGRPDQNIFVVFVLGTILTRTAGCVINDYADRHFDALVNRTKGRPLATKRIKPYSALLLFAVLSLSALALVMTLNRTTQQLALIGALMIFTYPFFKRFFPMPQAYLGIAFSWSIPMAYAAQTGSVPRIAWLLFIANILWTIAYDTMYAMADREDDVKLGLRSSAILFGDADKKIIGLLQLTTLLTLWLVGRDQHLGTWYQVGLGAAALFAIYEQLLIRQRLPENCLRAFLNNHYFGMAVFIGIALDFILISR